jgi:SAM-dependent methyltransferase
MIESYFVVRDACPSCTSIDYNVIYSSLFLQSPLKEFITNYYSKHGTIEIEYLKDASYTLEECKNCGLIYQKEVPNNILMAKIYEEWINPEINIEYHKKNDPFDHFIDYAHEIMRIITRLNRIPSSIKVLDYGMGLAKWALLAKAFGCDVYGTEISQGKKRHALECGIKLIDLSDTIEKQFDLINIDQVLEHLREPLTLLCQLKKYLKRDGIIKVCVPDGGEIKKKLKMMDWNAPKETKNSLIAVHPLEHINCFNRKSLITFVNKAGFEVLKVSNFMNFPLLLRNNPFRERDPRNIATIAREEWRYNFKLYPTYLLLKQR